MQVTHKIYEWLDTHTVSIKKTSMCVEKGKGEEGQKITPCYRITQLKNNHAVLKVATYNERGQKNVLQQV